MSYFDFLFVYLLFHLIIHLMYISKRNIQPQNLKKALASFKQGKSGHVCVWAQWFGTVN